MLIFQNSENPAEHCEEHLTEKDLCSSPNSMKSEKETTDRQKHFMTHFGTN